MVYRGKWALVTGASAGIGAAFAKSLAAKGADVALTARREERLKALALEIERDFKVKTRVISADLENPAAPKEIFEALRSDGLNIDLLINNAGYGLPGSFLESDYAAHRAFLECLLAAPVELAHLFLPGMQSRKWGRIVNVASLAGLTPGAAGHTLYGAAKAFLISFSQSLAAENEANGVRVEALCPGFTYSEFHDVNGTRSLTNQLPKYMFMRAEPVVEGSLRAIERGEIVYVPGAFNKFADGLVKTLPRSLAQTIVKRQSRRVRRTGAK